MPIMAHYEAPKISTLMQPCLQFSVYFDSDHNKALRLFNLIMGIIENNTRHIITLRMGITEKLRRIWLFSANKTTCLCSLKLALFCQH